MFSGHGYPQGWGMEGSANYSTTQASAQTGLVAFVYTDACLTGAFDEDGIASSGITVDVGTSDQYKYTSEPCLGEAYIRNSSGGALVHMGCARYGWGNPDYQNSDPEDEDRQDLDVGLDAPVEDLLQFVLPHLVALVGVLGLEDLAGISAVTVHDDGHMPGDRG